MSMFRDAHPLEVALFWILTGFLFSFYFFIKMNPGQVNHDLTNLDMSTEEIYFIDTQPDKTEATD